MTNELPGRDEALNQELQQLINDAKRYPADSGNPVDRANRRIILTKLINSIKYSGKLSKQSQWSGIANYQGIYEEALQITFIEICQNLANYNPEYPVMAWVNRIFNSRFYDLFDKERRRGIKWLPKNSQASHILSLDEINKDLPLENEVSEQEQLKEIIQADPERFLTKEYIQDNPQANLKVILLLVLEGKQWKEIAEEIGVPLSTASSFYQRRLRKIISYLQKYI